MRWFIKTIVTCSVVLGLIFWAGGGDMAVSAARTGWYVFGSGFGTFSNSAGHMKDGLNDAKAANDKQAAADAKKKQ
jgi:hypothetical protein